MSELKCLANRVLGLGPQESRNFLAQLSSNYRPSDKDFPRVIYNNRTEGLGVDLQGSGLW